MSRAPLAKHVATGSELSARLAAARAGTPFLVHFDGDDAQVIVPLAGRERLTIGRRAENDVPIPWDDRVSRVHAELERIGGEWVVIDDGLSANGTWVDDHRVSGRYRLHDGQTMRIGDTRIGYCAPADQVGGTLLTPSAGEPVAVSPAQRRVLVALCRPAFSDERYAPPPTNRDLAGELVLSLDSVKTHLTALYELFDLTGLGQGQKRTALIEHAIRTSTVTNRDFEPPARA